MLCITTMYLNRLLLGGRGVKMIHSRCISLLQSTLAIWQPDSSSFLLHKGLYWKIYVHGYHLAQNRNKIRGATENIV